MILGMVISHVLETQEYRPLISIALRHTVFDAPCHTSPIRHAHQVGVPS